MKVVLALVLTLLLFVIALPMAIGMGMGMGEMADCPMCTSPDNHLVLGICAAILSLLGLVVVLTSRSIRPVDVLSRAVLLSRTIYRPPRTA